MTHKAPAISRSPAYITRRFIEVWSNRQLSLMEMVWIYHYITAIYNKVLKDVNQNVLPEMGS
jgi:hypothetical protein